MTSLIQAPHQDWQDEANCRRVDSEVFFPDRTSKVAAQLAKQICAACTVQEACLAYALHTNEQWGAWGGLTTRERRLMLKAGVAA